MDTRNIITAVNFLLSNEADREELAARLAGRATLPVPNAEVSVSSTSSTGSSSSATHAAMLQAPIDLADHPLHPIPAPSASSHSLGDAAAAATIRDVATFLLRNDTDREELVNVLRRAAAAGEFIHAPPTSTAAESSAATTTATPSTEGTYGLDEKDMFNQLVMLETPALATAPTLSKL